MKFIVAVSCYFTITNYSFTEKLLINAKNAINAAEFPYFYKRLFFSRSQL
jgi:hypothetical protein